MNSTEERAPFCLRISACYPGSKSIDLGYSYFADASARSTAFNDVQSENSPEEAENFFALEKLDQRGMIFEDKIISQATAEAILGLPTSELIERALSS